ncbi:Alginate biosynthesis transcriptional regulatory protein AlgB [Fundidesulfovibrio magnetotacticus]|uniref:Alginate biosynthesis transcriptional regulatory protein AlgB n=1 Tax=Fundidesulfovibrio magnetotacticus TaxID=2730080 RepID=A0A6V8LQE6_9BACT|nr:response regulator [Fundidesulfovibrio magnetotacticus]GFK93200.1 Alginate biosynthesis transcriptional regulatory protein AlgB [Fundidesulfovibrio magnetotacticus]
MAEPVVLVIDDEPQLRSNLRDCFEDYGFTVLTAICAEDALEMLLREKVDACTVDIRLPGMTGNEFIAKASRMRPQLKFVIYTGSWNYEIPGDLANAGVTPEEIFNKPCEDPEIIARTIERLIARGAAAPRH